MVIWLFVVMSLLCVDADVGRDVDVVCVVVVVDDVVVIDVAGVVVDCDVSICVVVCDADGVVGIGDVCIVGVNVGRVGDIDIRSYVDVVDGVGGCRCLC